MSSSSVLLKTPENGEKFSNYKWQYFSSLTEGPIRSRAKLFLKSINWPGLEEFATTKRNGIKCTILPDIGLGYNHMVRIIEFEDGDRWVARLKLPSLLKPDTSEPEQALDARMSYEFNTISFLREKTSIPIPKIHAFEARPHCSVGAPFMLMDCLKGNVGMDIECINPDGTLQQGPIPGLGGPFITATEFFEAWATHSKFGKTDEQLRAGSGQFADEIACSTALFLPTIKKLADKLSVHNHGPFPIYHGDFGHNNVIVDDDYRVLGVIDWEGAFAGPWEIFGDFPLSISTVPPAMDVPWGYNEDGSPISVEVAQKFADQKDYVAAVKEEENRIGQSHRLSEALQNTERQQLATAMRLFRDGKVGWYSKVVGKLAAK
ncbi:protein kinase-like (PK-like) protein [Fusarium austroafricanum]|uniref:Protein kinase-like (PK-like) protein n=1 Tax=Fusarium austroafricanum TaxID=2364996 RepID=A0A8H4JCB6_9HYPO|nr:protein kinase-like (PK-like) protein [Fusarium austroafricanum]